MKNAFKMSATDGLSRPPLRGGPRRADPDEDCSRCRFEEATHQLVDEGLPCNDLSRRNVNGLSTDQKRQECCTVNVSGKRALSPRCQRRCSEECRLREGSNFLCISVKRHEVGGMPLTFWPLDDARGHLFSGHQDLSIKSVAEQRNVGEIM